MSGNESSPNSDPGSYIASADKRQANISWPLPVDGILEQHVETSRAMGTKMSRREMAAIIMFASRKLTAEALELIVTEYRGASMSDMLPETPPNETVNGMITEF